MADQEQTAGEIGFHPIANVLPLMADSEFNALIEDIRENGLRDDIILYEGTILDGRNRYRACKEVGVEPSFKEYDGPDPVGYVVSRNLHRRRQLNKSQRALAAARLAKLPPGRPSKKSGQQAGIPTQEEAAKLFDVGPRSVRRAAVVVENGAQELIEAVACGRLTIAAAEDIAKASHDRQGEILNGGKRAISNYLARVRNAVRRKSAAPNGEAAEQQIEPPDQAVSVDTINPAAEQSPGPAPAGAPSAPGSADAGTVAEGDGLPTAGAAEFEEMRHAVRHLGLDAPPKDLFTGNAPHVRPSRWALLRVPESLSSDEQARLGEALRALRDDFKTDLFIHVLPVRHR